MMERGSLPATNRPPTAQRAPAAPCAPTARTNQSAYLARLINDAHVKQLVLQEHVAHAKAGGAKLRCGVEC